MTESWHGTRSGYINHACRCEDCREANRVYTAALRLRLSSQRDDRLVHPRAPHGTLNGYTNYRCRCWPCTEAKKLCDRDGAGR